MLFIVFNETVSKSEPIKYKNKKCNQHFCFYKIFLIHDNIKKKLFYKIKTIKYFCYTTKY